MTDNFQEDGYLNLAVAIGQSCLAWNSLHETLAISYQIVTSPGNDKALIKWHNMRSDRIARWQLRKKVSNGCSSIIYADSITWALDEVDKIAEPRNIAAHAPFYLLNNIPEPSTQYCNLMGDKAWREDSILLFEWVRESSVVLRNFVRSTNFEQEHNESGTLPDRPILPVRPKKLDRLDKILHGVRAAKELQFLQPPSLP